jgi:hypothetical protein
MIRFIISHAPPIPELVIDGVPAIATQNNFNYVGFIGKTAADNTSSMVFSNVGNYFNNLTADQGNSLIEINIETGFYIGSLKNNGQYR